MEEKIIANVVTYIRIKRVRPTRSRCIRKLRKLRIWLGVEPLPIAPDDDLESLFRLLLQTTQFPFDKYALKILFPMQIYTNFESNSQQNHLTLAIFQRCFRCKFTQILKAIHNTCHAYNLADGVLHRLEYVVKLEYRTVDALHWVRHTLRLEFEFSKSLVQLRNASVGVAVKVDYKFNSV
mgnify:CR=1 FL=1